MRVIVRIRSDPRACILALILVMALGTIAAVLLAITVRNGVLELCPLVLYTLLDKILSALVHSNLNFLSPVFSQDRIGGGFATFQKRSESVASQGGP